MNIKSPYKNIGQTKPKESVLDMVLGMSAKMAQLDDAIAKAKESQQQSEADNTQRQIEHNQMKAEHKAHMNEFKQAVQIVNHVHKNMQKGEKGQDAPIIDTQSIIEKVKSQIRQPKDGETPVIDYGAITQKIITMIPKPKDGKDAKVDHEALIEQIFQELHSGKKKLLVKNIGDFTDGLEQTMRPIRSMLAGFRGGGDVVTAGSNITITTDVNGKKVITGSAGSGFTQLTATETPNGAITVFTFAAAVAQPTWIVSDNVWMKATSKAGTVNWTWNAGAKQATMTIPPLDDIWGVV